MLQVAPGTSCREHRVGVSSKGVGMVFIQLNDSLIPATPARNDQLIPALARCYARKSVEIVKGGLVVAASGLGDEGVVVRRVVDCSGPCLAAQVMRCDHDGGCGKAFDRSVGATGPLAAACYACQIQFLR